VLSDAHQIERRPAELIAVISHIGADYTVRYFSLMRVNHRWGCGPVAYW